MPTNKKSIVENLTNGSDAGNGKPQTENQTPKTPLHHANLALQSLSARQAEQDAANDAKAYAVTYSQTYAMEVLRYKAEFLQSFHQQSSHSQVIARDAQLQDGNERFFSQNQGLENLIQELNNYQPQALPAPQYNLLPPSLG